MSKDKTQNGFKESEEVEVGIYKGSVLSSFLFAVVAVVVTELTGKGVLSELLYANDIVMISEIVMGHRNEFIKWKVAFECKGLKANLGITKVMVNDSIIKDGLSKSKVDQCEV